MTAVHPALSELGRAPLPAIYLREAWFEFLRTLRTPAFAVPTLAFPVAFYLVFAVLIPGQWGRFDKASYLLATYGTFGVIGPALFGFGVGVALERQQGVLELKRVSPMPIGAYFFAKIAMSVLFAGAVLALLGLCAAFAGGVDLTPGTWLRLAFVLLAGTLPFCALGLMIGTLAKGQAAIAVVNLVYLPMALLSGLWFPLAVFPPLMQKLAVAWPAFHLSQLALGAVGQLQAVAVATHAGTLAAMTVVFLAIAAARLRAA